MKLYQIDTKGADWKLLDNFAARTVFQTHAWLEFVAESQGATPLLAVAREGSDVIGHFTGLTFSKFGIKALAQNETHHSTL